ncbi:MAG: cytochrome c oxidase subunit II [SAR202 cluster bacterium Io17-Chloro-G2]|nr:MAG: cytochrome c oxidase subunit II [SAR202 cluster bacterium Io17-Chloro-G2]
MPNPPRSKFIKSLAISAVLLVLTVACSQGDRSTWNAAGPVADKQLLLFNVLVWIMAITFILVEGVLIYAAIRFRARPGQERPSQVHGNLPLEIAWTVIPTILIMGLGIWSVVALWQLDKPPASADYVLEVTATGHQWWFEFEYADAGGGKTITTANELRVPVDTPVQVWLESDDVIHSLWIPRLAGKVDMIPTHTNRLWFQADSNKIETLPATFLGQCAEFCGLSHALMKFEVTVMEQDDYDAWVEAYGQPSALSPQAQQGQNVFNANCSSCHTATGADAAALVDGRVAGFLAGGNIAPAPNLTDLATRQKFAAGLLDLNEDNLRSWLEKPDDIKPGNYMSARAPFYQDGEITLSDDDISAVIEYLISLK